MKLKFFDRLQHYYLDKVWENCAAGKDVAATLDRYLQMVEGNVDPEDFITALHKQLREHPAMDPDHGQWRTWGFVVPFHGQEADQYISNPLEIEGTYEQALAVAIPGTNAIILCVEKREKVLPSSAINDKLMDRAKEMAEREDRELNRKDYAILKDEVTAALLTTAPVRRSRTYVMFDQRDQLVFTGSQKAAEETNAIIRRAFSSLPTVPAYTNEVKLHEFFKQVMKHDDEVKKDFTPGSTIKLKSDEGEVITVKDGEIDDVRYVELLKQGFNPTEMEIAVRTDLPGMEHIWFKMNHKGDIKSFSTSAEADGSEFDDQYERGTDGFQSKMAELWVLTRAIREFNDMMAETGVRVERSKVGEYMDGDDMAIEKDAKEKAKAKAPVPESSGEEEVEDEWDIPDEEEEDDGDI